MKRRDYMRNKILSEVASPTSPTATPAGPRPGGLGGTPTAVIPSSSPIAARPKAAPYGAPKIGPSPRNVVPVQAAQQQVQSRQALEGQRMELAKKRLELQIAKTKNNTKSQSSSTSTPTPSSSKTSQSSSINASYYPKGSYLYETLQIFKKALKEQKSNHYYK